MTRALDYALEYKLLRTLPAIGYQNLLPEVNVSGGHRPKPHRPSLRFPWDGRGRAEHRRLTYDLSTLKDAGWIPDGGLPLRNIPRHNGSRADNSVIAYGDTGKDEGTAADPNIRSDHDRAPKFKHLSTLIGITRVVGS